MSNGRGEVLEEEHFFVCTDITITLFLFFTVIVSCQCRTHLAGSSSESSRFGISVGELGTGPSLGVRRSGMSSF